MKRIVEQRDKRFDEITQKAEKAQLKREQARFRAHEELHHIQENKKRIAMYKEQQRDAMLANKLNQLQEESEFRLNHK